MWGIVGTLAGIVLLVLIASSTMRQSHVSCEVCITYKGRSQCRSARATSKKDALRTATDIACENLTGSMAEGIQCRNTPPDSQTCKP